MALTKPGPDMLDMTAIAADTAFNTPVTNLATSAIATTISVVTDGTFDAGYASVLFE